VYVLCVVRGKLLVRHVCFMCIMCKLLVIRVCFMCSTW
jgi:hypothetical protein